MQNIPACRNGLIYSRLRSQSVAEKSTELKLAILNGRKNRAARTLREKGCRTINIPNVFAQKRSEIQKLGVYSPLRVYPSAF